MIKTAINRFLYFLIMFVLLAGCAANDVYNRELKKVILGRITIVEDDKKYDFIEVYGSGIKSFVKQPIFGNPFGVDIYGHGLVIGNATKEEYEINRVSGRYNDLIIKRMFPTIHVKIGREEGIYYFGSVTLIYKNNKLVDIWVKDDRKKDLADAKKYINRFKKLKVFDLTGETRKEIDNIYRNGLEEN